MQLLQEQKAFEAQKQEKELLERQLEAERKTREEAIHR